MSDHTRVDEKSKQKDLDGVTVKPDRVLTTNQGLPQGEDQNSLRAGVRGPTLMEDLNFREKIQHFDHERIPERVVHARGAGAHGYFQLYESLEDYTTARVLCDTGLKTPTFVRFSTVLGFRGSADTARDVRGFAVKFYTPEGNWDIVGNNIPVFFIQDAVKFPDLIHAGKPEPNNEIPQAATAHSTFWDFIALTPESLHMIMWAMSDRAIPRSYRMMDGFGVHTFRLVNAQGRSTFVKFHWKPVLGAHSLVWDEAQKLQGMDPDFHRRDLWEAIENGDYPEFELAVQLMPDGDESNYDFDILDATKIWPEDLFPLRRIGKMVLNRNPDNYFAETEQVAFKTDNIVPGIDFTDDPLLQGRNFSYLDTQLSRLGSPNFAELPINRPLPTAHNHQRDAQMRYTINTGRVSYQPNSIDDNIPNAIPAAEGGFATYPAQVSGPKVRQRSPSFDDHYGQARLFWNSMTGPEKEHIAKALQFELSKVDVRHVRQKMLEHLVRINPALATQVALALGEKVDTEVAGAQPGGSADVPAEMQVLANATSPTTASGGVQQTSGLSLLEGQPQSAKGRKVAVLVADGVDGEQVKALKKALQGAGAMAMVVGPHLGAVSAGDGSEVITDLTYANSGSVMVDAVFVPGGAGSVGMLVQQGDARKFIDEAYKHGKPIGAVGEGVDLVSVSEAGKLARNGNGALAEQGLVLGKDTAMGDLTESFIAALAHHRFFNRGPVDQVSA